MKICSFDSSQFDQKILFSILFSKCNVAKYSLIIEYKTLNYLYFLIIEY